MDQPSNTTLHGLSSLLADLPNGALAGDPDEVMQPVGALGLHVLAGNVMGGPKRGDRVGPVWLP